jgi:hypothetical protein
LDGRRVVEQFMVKGEHGGRGPQTTSVTTEEPVLVPMSEAERAATVSVLVDILTAWWTKHGNAGPEQRPDSRSVKP